MQFLRNAADVPLKRLYRYALRKTIGPFLLKDVEIDQLDVQIREGKVTLLDLQVGSPGLMTRGRRRNRYPVLPRALVFSVLSRGCARRRCIALQNCVMHALVRCRC